MSPASGHCQHYICKHNIMIFLSSDISITKENVKEKRHRKKIVTFLVRQFPYKYLLDKQFTVKQSFVDQLGTK